MGNSYTKDYQECLVNYLTLIQGNISRMAGNSAIMKGFAATVITAIYGIMMSEGIKWYYIALALLPLFAFVRLDMYYYQLEKRYRNLYKLVSSNSIDINGFYVLDLKDERLKEYSEIINKDSGILCAITSTSVWQFYMWFIITGIIIMILVA